MQPYCTESFSLLMTVLLIQTEVRALSYMDLSIQAPRAEQVWRLNVEYL